MYSFRLILPVVFTMVLSTATAQVTRSVDTLYHSGVAAWDRMEYALAAEKLNEFLYHQPASADAYFYRASARQALDELENALTDYSIVMELEPGHSDALHARAVLNYELKRYDAARKDFIRLKSMPRGETNTILFMRSRYGGGVSEVGTVQSDNVADIYQYLGMIEKEQQQYHRALAYLDSALYIRSQKPEYYVNRGLIYQAMNNLKQAREDYLRALSIYPGYALAEYNLAVLMQMTGEDVEADSYFTRTIEDNPDSPYPYRQRAYNSLQKGNFEEALADLDHALRIDDSDAETWLNHGLALSKLKRWSEAVHSYTKAIELKPDLEKAYLNRGNTLYRLELYQEALDDYKVALLFRPDYGIAFYHRGLVYHQLGDDESACADLEKAIQQRVKPALKARAKICSNGM